MFLQNFMVINPIVVDILVWNKVVNPLTGLIAARLISKCYTLIRLEPNREKEMTQHE